MGKNNFQQKTSVTSSSYWGKPVTAPVSAPQERLVDFSFHAPGAFSVNVVGSFNKWTPGSLRLEKDSAGTWRGKMLLKPGIYQYRVFVDGEWFDDPGAEKTAPNEFGTRNAILEVKQG